MALPPAYPQVLTNKMLENVKPKATRYEIGDGKVAGLRLAVHPSGAMSWVLRYEFRGRARKLTIGKLEDVPLASARRIAAQHRLKIAAGGDPAAEKIEARREAVAAKLAVATTVEAAYGDYGVDHLAHLKPSTRAMVEDIFDRFIVPGIGRKALDDVTPEDIKALSAGPLRRNQYNTANRIFVVVRAFFNWCRAGLLTRNNPTDGLKKPKPDRQRDRVLADSEIVGFWNGCTEIGYPFGPAMKLLLITLTRRGEIEEATWPEFDLDAATWTIPSKRTKNSRSHVIHLTPLAIRILKDLPRFAGRQKFLFTTDGTKPAANWAYAKSRLEPYMPGSPPWVIHDLRRTGATGLARLGVPIHVTERILNHVSGTLGGLVGVYQIHGYEQERKEALEKWSAYIELLNSR
ncbi:tyrosine-type recombinase/integrase [Rhodopseudomonas palustris]